MIESTEPDVVDKSRKYLAYVTYGIMGIGIGLMLMPGMGLAGSLLVGGAILDIAADKTIGEEVSKQWKDLKSKIGNIFTFKGANTPHKGTQQIAP